ncbi:hypothetical protein GL309_08825 [Nocardia seriolae]|nr:hypothetical protein [Nocardia seriolae]
MSESCCGASPSGSTATLNGAATVVLVGNPNVGKSTLFNAATGARQRVGNWPGTTVEVTEGPWKLERTTRFACSTCPAPTPCCPPHPTRPSPATPCSPPPDPTARTWWSPWSMPRTWRAVCTCSRRCSRPACPRWWP